MASTPERRKALAEVQRLIQCALEAGHVPMLQDSSGLLSDFASAQDDEDEAA